MKTHKGYLITRISDQGLTVNTDREMFALDVVCLECSYDWTRITEGTPATLICPHCEERELQDPSQWDWDKAEKKPPVSSTYCPWTHNWDCDSPTKPCPEKKTVHEAHDWWSRTLRTTIQHCPGIEKKKELETLHCGAVVVHTKHSWSYRPNETLICPGVEKKHTAPYISNAPCPDTTRKTMVHTAHSWEALNIIWWCSGLEKKLPLARQCALKSTHKTHTYLVGHDVRCPGVVNSYSTGYK
ncbi:hypothetical protein LCGC14_2488340 [marine sediment metagenome]|uniref:Uncharacterized protein n=1 Tax=marine sediment metagenome TaxID=412755 RepID=A0A0F9B5J6_9ZZZZ